MDEPLSNLDAKLRVSTRTQIAALQTRLGVTTVYVTHDQVEAMTMGDRVAVLKDGLLQQCDSPLQLYDAPRNLFVAGFIGSPAMNLIEGNVQQDGVHLGDYTVPVPRETLAKAANEQNLVLGIRPENFRVSNEIPRAKRASRSISASSRSWAPMHSSTAPCQVSPRTS